MAPKLTLMNITVDSEYLNFYYELRILIWFCQTIYISILLEILQYYPSY